MSYKNFATLILNEVTWKQVFYQFNGDLDEIEAAKLPYLSKFKYPSKKTY